MEEDIFEAYSDSFDSMGNSYGMVLNFNLSPSKMGKEPTTVVRVRMSWEMAKVLTFILRRYIKNAEAKRGLSYPLPIDLLNELKISPDDWDMLWMSENLDKLEG